MVERHGPARRHLVPGGLAGLVGVPLVLALLAARPALAADSWSTPYPGIRLLTRTTSAPNKIRALVVDLCSPGIKIRATRASERGRTASSFGSLVNALAVVNGDFFDPGYVPRGLAIGEGARWSGTRDDDESGFFAFGTSRVEWSTPKEIVSSPPAWMQQVVSGKPRIVNKGEAITGYGVSDLCGNRNPRTAMGLSEDGRTLYLVVVDGRSSSSIGMTCAELATLLRGLGAYNAINLDGGGSTTMWLKGRGVLNDPSDGPQRVVANHLAILDAGDGLPGSCPDARAEVLAQGAWATPGGTSDLDGDGFADVCGRTDDSVRCFRGTATGLGGAVDGPDLSNDDGWAAPDRYGTIRMGDVDGDGRADLCARSAAGFGCWPSTGTGFGARIAGPAWSDASGWDELAYYGTIRLVDIDGDGRDDACARAASGIVCYPATGTGFGDRIDGPALSDDAGWSAVSRYGTIRWGDVNGDGRVDVCARRAEGVRCWLASGTGFPDVVEGPAWTDDGDWRRPHYFATIRLQDVDGDGRADLCARGPGGFRCHLSQGSAFGPQLDGPTLGAGGGWGWRSHYGTLRLGDLDGDGDADLCGRGEEGISCWPFDGAGFGAALAGPALADASGWDSPGHFDTLRLADVSGDGRADLCGRRDDGFSCWLADGAGFPTRVDGPAWSDAAGWDLPDHGLTIQAAGPRCRRAPEVCDGVDNDCDGVVDPGCPGSPDGGGLVPGADGGGVAPGADGGGTVPAADGGGGGGGGLDGLEGGCGCRAGGGRTPVGSGTGAGAGAGALLVLLICAARAAGRRRGARRPAPRPLD